MGSGLFIVIRGIAIDTGKRLRRRQHSQNKGKPMRLNPTPDFVIDRSQQKNGQGAQSATMIGAIVAAVLFLLSGVAL